MQTVRLGADASTCVILMSRQRGFTQQLVCGHTAKLANRLRPTTSAHSLWEYTFLFVLNQNYCSQHDINDSDSQLCWECLCILFIGYVCKRKVDLWVTKPKHNTPNLTICVPNIGYEHYELKIAQLFLFLIISWMICTAEKISSIQQ